MKEITTVEKKFVFIAFYDVSDLLVLSCSKFNYSQRLRRNEKCGFIIISKKRPTLLQVELDFVRLINVKFSGKKENKSHKFIGKCFMLFFLFSSYLILYLNQSSKVTHQTSKRLEQFNFADDFTI